MLKYDYLDDQTLRVTNRRNFFVSGCVSVFVAYPIYSLLADLEALNWLEKYFGPNGEIIFLFILIPCLIAFMQFLAFYYGPAFSINRDGRITTRVKSLGFILGTKIFEKGHYKFLIEETHTGEVYMVDGPNLGPSDEYKMSVVDENGRRFKLFAVTTDDEIKEFEKKFSDFTGFVLRRSLKNLKLMLIPCRPSKIHTRGK